jgi:hypothetical protein
MGVSCVAALGSSLIVLQVTTSSSGFLKTFKIKDTRFQVLKIISEQNDHQFPDFEILQRTGKELAFQCRFFDQFFNLFS